MIYYVYGQRYFSPTEWTRNLWIQSTALSKTNTSKNDNYVIVHVLHIISNIGLHFGSKRTEFLGKSSTKIDILSLFFEPKWSPNYTSYNTPSNLWMVVTVYLSGSNEGSKLRTRGFDAALGVLVLVIGRNGDGRIVSGGADFRGSVGGGE